MRYELLLDSIKSPETRNKYEYAIKDYCKFLNTDLEELLKIDIEDSIIDYILFLKKRVSSATLNSRLAGVYHFYTMNDVVLNRIKISKFKGEFVKVKKDRAYTHEEISKLLQLADLRMKCCILLMSSAGLRLGAIADLKIRHLQNMKLTVYENSNEEYYTFITPECDAVIQEYIQYRQRFGEKVDKEAYLIRNNFDNFGDNLQGKKISKHTIRNIFYHLLKKSGIDENIMMTHGFRKFFTTQLINSKVNPEIREMLMGHKIGLASCYYRPSEQEMYAEFEKSIDNLTIDPANRLQRKVEVLTIEKSKVDYALSQIEEVKKRIGIV
jgi:integrase